MLACLGRGSLPPGQDRASLRNYWRGARSIVCVVLSVGERVEQRRQGLLVMSPLPHRGAKNRLADLDRAGRSDRPLRLVEVEACGLPRQPAPVHESAGHAFQVSHGLLIIDFQEGHRQNSPPVRHDPLVLLKPGSDVPRVVGPPHLLKMRLPAGDGHVAEIAAAVNELRHGKEARQQTEQPVVVRHLVHDPLRGRTEARSFSKCRVASRFAAARSIRPRPSRASRPCPPSAAIVSPASLISPAPKTWQWLARICSTSDVPDRGSPTTKTGTSLCSPNPRTRS